MCNSTKKRSSCKDCLFSCDTIFKKQIDDLVSRLVSSCSSEQTEIFFFNEKVSEEDHSLKYVCSPDQQLLLLIGIVSTVVHKYNLAFSLEVMEEKVGYIPVRITIAR